MVKITENQNRIFSHKRDDLTGKFDRLDFVLGASVLGFPRPIKKDHEDTLTFDEESSSYIANVGINEYSQKFSLQVEGQEPKYENQIIKYLSIPNIFEDEL